MELRKMLRQIVLLSAAAIILAFSTPTRGEQQRAETGDYVGEIKKIGLTAITVNDITFLLNDKSKFRGDPNPDLIKPGRSVQITWIREIPDGHKYVESLTPLQAMALPPVNVQPLPPEAGGQVPLGCPFSARTLEGFRKLDSPMIYETLLRPWVHSESVEIERIFRESQLPPYGRISGVLCAVRTKPVFSQRTHGAEGIPPLSIIVKLDGVLVKDERTLNKAMRGLRAGQPCEVTMRTVALSASGKSWETNTITTRPVSRLVNSMQIICDRTVVVYGRDPRGREDGETVADHLKWALLQENQDVQIAMDLKNNFDAMFRGSLGTRNLESIANKYLELVGKPSGEWRLLRAAMTEANSVFGYFPFPGFQSMASAFLYMQDVSMQAAVWSAYGQAINPQVQR